MKKQLFTCLSGLMLSGAVFSQDIHFSQYFVAPQLINPSAFGVMNSFEAGLQYKGQWNSFTNGYTSFAAFANKSFRPKKQQTSFSKESYTSVGLNLIYDKAGASQLTHFKAELPVNVTKRVSNAGFITVGLYLGYGQIAVKNDAFTWGSQFDGFQYNSSLSNNETRVLQAKSYVDCGAGASFVILKDAKDDVSAPQNIIGFSVNHINRPDISLYSTSSEALGMRINFYEHAYIYFNNSPLSLVPSLLVQYQSKAYEVVLGASIRRQFTDAESKKSKYIGLGVYYRLQDMCALNCMIELNKYSIGLNYDFNVSKLISASKSFGGLEIALRMSNPAHHIKKGAATILEKF